MAARRAAAAAADKPRRAIKRPRAANDEQPITQRAPTQGASSLSECEWVDVRSLRPWSGNPKVYSEQEVDELLASVRVNGWGRPGLANRHKGLEGEIIDGHRTRLAALKLGDEVAPGAPGPYLVPFRWVNLPAKRAHALALAAARIPKSELDKERMQSIARSHELDPLDWVSAGFAESEVRALMFDPWPESGEKTGKGGKVEPKFSVMIDCASEEQQTAVLEWCEREGLSCRALM